MTFVCEGAWNTNEVKDIKTKLIKKIIKMIVMMTTKVMMHGPMVMKLSLIGFRAMKKST